ncbi:MAG: type ISP restriction/modification enzyme, partial [Promethearchaeota archaeon]
ELVNEFFKEQISTISTPKELATRMASLAKIIEGIIEKALADKDDKGNFHEQLEGFKQVLLHSLTPEQFADMYAQTICYGLFAAKYNFKNGTAFTRKEAAFIVPKSNPFLRKLFGQMAGPEMDSRVDWAVDALAELLNRTDINAILKDFGKRTKREDTVVHFYETFLAQYNPKLRESRGVYYTPEPVVSYIVRSVDYILKNDFGLKDGLADKSKIKFGKSDKKENSKECHKVLILDPAVGTGTFLFNVIDHIHETIVNKGQGGTWSEYVSKHLLPRLFGFELLVAPYAVAHMKLDLQLKEKKYEFKTGERLNVILTNSLEEAYDLKGLSAFENWIAEEANEAGIVKQDMPVMVILGNPPYSGHSENKGKWINSLLRGQDDRTDTITENYFEVDGKPLGERNPKWLNDDYVKFIRFAQHRIEQTGYGILAFITNHSYLDNPTFRGMRQSLMNSFDDIYILDLHGNSKKKEKCPDGSKDENVFDIQQGVAIGIYIKKPNGESTTKVLHKDLWGLREVRKKDKSIGGKYFWLNENSVDATDWTELDPANPYYLFIPQERELIAEFEKGWKIPSIMKTNSAGLVTARDKLVINFEQDKLIKKIREFSKLNVEEARQKYALGKDTRDWKVSLAQNDVLETKSSQINIQPILYRPFDIRFTYYTGKTRGIICMPRNEVMRHFLNTNNMGIICTRQTRDNWDVHCSKFIMGHKSLAAFDINSLFPLYLYSEDGMLNFEEVSNAPGGRRPNLENKFIDELAGKIKLKFVPDGKGDLKKTFGPEDVFNYMYGVFHSPEYRKRYAEFLKIDFPRLPLTSKRPLFRKLGELGNELVQLHLQEAKIDPITKYP